MEANSDQVDTSINRKKDSDTFGEYKETEEVSVSVLQRQEFERKISDKTHPAFREDFITLSVLVFLKKNVDKFYIHPSKRASIVW